MIGQESNVLKRDYEKGIITREKTEGIEMEKIKRIHNAFSNFLWGAVIFYLLHSFTTDCIQKINFVPIYKDAIKAVDPLEGLDKHCPQDFATF
jgi:hypothetical protein